MPVQFSKFSLYKRQNGVYSTQRALLGIENLAPHRFGRLERPVSFHTVGD